MRYLACTSLLVLGLVLNVVGREPSGDVQDLLERYRSLRPRESDLTLFQLNWVPTLQEAKKKASKEKRPILLILVRNSNGDIFRGHC